MNGTLNKVILIGNVGKDVEIKYFDDNNLIARFPLATSEVYKDRNGEKVERTEWHNIVARNQLAEIFRNYVKKGDKLYIEGKIRTREYVDNSGIKKFFTEIHVQQFTFLSPKQPVDSTQVQKPVENIEESSPSSSQSKEEGNDDLPF